MVYKHSKKKTEPSWTDRLSLPLDIPLKKLRQSIANFKSHLVKFQVLVVLVE